MTISPDTKNWTWVLERPCPECGFDASAVSPTDVADLTRDDAVQWEAVLADPAAGNRPRPDKWSPLEYACHVRDVYRIFDERLTLMLTEDDPVFANWDQDATAVEDRYGEQSPSTVAVELADAANRLADRFASVEGDGLAASRAQERRLGLHDRDVLQVPDPRPVHHQWDVTVDL